MIETPAMHDALRTHNLLELLEDLTIVVAREIMQKPQRTPQKMNGLIHTSNHLQMQK